jgi:hypothetical protein
LPKLDTPSARSFGRMLIMLAPKNAGASARGALELLHDRLEDLDTAWVAQAEVEKKIDARPLDRRVDGLFGAVRDRLENYRVLGESADRTRALDILQIVFADGLGFLRLGFPQQHAEGERRFALIEKQGLRPDLVRLVGKPFVDELYDAQDDYGKALGITARVAPGSEPTRILEPLRAVFEAAETYAVHLVSLARAQPARTAAVRDALSPIDKFRKSNGVAKPETPSPDPASAPLPADAPAPDSPLPPVPAEV